jgi:type IV secretion system protein VirD4
VAVQASSQLDTVYGGAYARELRDTFPAALVMFGAAEMEMLQRAEEWTQQSTRRSESFDQATGAKTLSGQLGSTLEYRRLLPENRDHARLLLRGTAGVRTEIPDWSVFVELFDRAVAGVSAGSSSDGMWDRLVQRHRRALSGSGGGP